MEAGRNVEANRRPAVPGVVVSATTPYHPRKARTGPRGSVTEPPG